MINKDEIFIVSGAALLTLWAAILRFVPAEHRLIYYFSLPLILVPLLYVILMRNRYTPMVAVKGLFLVVILAMGIISFAHAILKVDLIR